MFLFSGRLLFTYFMLFEGDEHLGSFHNLAMVSGAAICICMQITLLYVDFDNPISILRNGIVLWFSNSALRLLFIIDKYLSYKMIGSVMSDLSMYITDFGCIHSPLPFAVLLVSLLLVSFLFPDCLHCTYLMDFEGALYICIFTLLTNLCVCVCSYVHATVCMWSSENSWWERVLFFPPHGSWVSSLDHEAWPNEPSCWLLRGL